MALLFSCELHELHGICSYSRCASLGYAAWCRCRLYQLNENSGVLVEVRHVCYTCPEICSYLDSCCSFCSTHGQLLGHLRHVWQNLDNFGGIFWQHAPPFTRDDLLGVCQTACLQGMSPTLACIHLRNRVPEVTYGRQEQLTYGTICRYMGSALLQFSANFEGGQQLKGCHGIRSSFLALCEFASPNAEGRISGCAGVYAVAPPANSGITVDQYSIYLRQTGEANLGSCCQSSLLHVLILACFVWARQHQHLQQHH